MSSDKSTGQIVGSIVGAVVGYFSGNIALGIAVGNAIGGYVDPPELPGIEGPRLNDLVAQTASYGTPIPRIYGTAIIPGNIIWLENDELFELVRKDKQGGKGGGGEQSIKTYTYFATFGVSLCEGPILAIKRIWAGGNLIYDAGSNDLGTVVASNKSALSWVLYTGLDDDDPDPREEADKGTANTPRYPGIARVYFYDFDLSDYGNTLQAVQLQFEVITSGSDTLTLLASTANAPDKSGRNIGACNYFKDGQSVSYYPVWDTSYETRLATEVEEILESASAPTFFVMPTELQESWNFVANGRADVPTYMLRGKFEWLDVEEFGVVVPGWGFFATAQTNIFDFSAASGAWVLNNDKLYMLVSDTLVRPGARSRYEVARAEITDAHNLDTNTDSSEVYVITNTGITVLDGDDLSTIDTWAIAWNSTGVTGDFRIRYYDDRLYCLTDSDSVNELYIVDASDGTLLDTVVVNDPEFSAGQYINMLIDSGVLLLAKDEGDSWDKRFFALDTLSDNSATLSDIVTAECLKTGLLSESDLNVSELTDDVNGLKVGKITSPRSVISLLQGGYQFDIVPSGYKIYFKKRGGSSIKTISEDYLGATEYGTENVPALTIDREMDTQLPKKVVVRYFDISRNGDLNEQYSPERTNTTATKINVIDLPLFLSSDEAARIAEILWSAGWLERDGYSFSLPPTYIDLEPSDIITLDMSYGQLELRIETIDAQSTGLLKLTAKANSAATWTSLAVGDTGLPPDETIPLAAPGLAVLMDIPIIRNTDDYPGIAAAMGSVYAGWLGGVLYRSTDGEQTFNPIQAFAGSVPIGYATNALTQNDGYRIDRQSELNLGMYSGSLSSITEAQMLTGLQWCAYGANSRWELIRYATATLNADGTYTLTTLIRGCRGTEWTTGLHVVGDAFVFLDDSDVAGLGISLEQIGVPSHWRGVGVGLDVGDATSQLFTYNGVNLKPLSPVHASASRDGSDNISIDAYRRSRYTSNFWTFGTSRPLGESSESYELEIYENSSYTNLLRTIESTSLPIEYTAVDETADFGYAQLFLNIRLYQISESIGRGYALSDRVYTGLVPDVPDYILSYEPLGYWRLDETSGTVASDSSSNANDATYQNSPTLNQGSLINSGDGSSVSMDGSNDYVAVDTPANFSDLSECTIVMVVSPDNISARRKLIAKGSDVGGDRSKFSWELTMDQTTGKVRIGFSEGANYEQLYHSTKSVGTSAPHLLVYGYDADDLLVCIDGDIETATRTTTGQNDETGSLHIGRDNKEGTGEDEYDGKMAEVAIFNRLLTNDEITDLYAAFLTAT